MEGNSAETAKKRRREVDDLKLSLEPADEMRNKEGDLVVQMTLEHLMMRQVGVDWMMLL